ncbi:MAG: FHA domain-containing protein [Leptolyngbyaceae cyanobacterium CSU_1_4]|nr:FHA domain-containing protein [Leptolyngbyaceae cyanobacterium CSU_1_4]
MTHIDRLPSGFAPSGFIHSQASPDAASDLSSMDTSIHSGLQDRLGLYQVFLRLYENHRGLLDEILGLESSGTRPFGRSLTPYLQGMVIGEQISIVTNLLHGKTQATTQPQNTWLIGRDSCQVSIALPDRRLSRCHASVQYVEGQGFYLTDLGSSNGSVVNGELIQGATLLKDGDRIRLGSLIFTFFLCQSTHRFQPVNSNSNGAAIANLCLPLKPFTQLETEVELLEEIDATYPPENSSGVNFLEDTCRFIRKQNPPKG